MMDDGDDALDADAMVTLWEDPGLGGPAGSAFLDLDAMQLEFDRMTPGRLLQLWRDPDSPLDDALVRAVSHIRFPFDVELLAPLHRLAVLISDHEDLIRAIDPTEDDVAALAHPGVVLSERAALAALVAHGVECFEVGKEVASKIPGGVLSPAWPPTLTAVVASVLEESLSIVEPRIGAGTAVLPASAVLPFRAMLVDAKLPEGETAALRALYERLHAVVVTAELLRDDGVDHRQDDDDLRVLQARHFRDVAARMSGDEFDDAIAAFLAARASARAALWLGVAAWGAPAGTPPDEEDEAAQEHRAFVIRLWHRSAAAWSHLPGDEATAALADRLAEAVKQEPHPPTRYRVSWPLVFAPSLLSALIPEAIPDIQPAFPPENTGETASVKQGSSTTGWWVEKIPDMDTLLAPPPVPTGVS